MYVTYPVPVVEARHALHYDGTNSADIAALIADFTVTGETTTNLSFTSGGTTHTVARGGYIAYAGGVVSAVYNNRDDFTDALTEVSTADHVHDLRLTTCGAKPAPSDS